MIGYVKPGLSRSSTSLSSGSGEKVPVPPSASHTFCAECGRNGASRVNRVANLINKNFGEIPPLDEDSMTNEDRGLLEEASAAFDVVGSSIETHHQKHALSEAMRVVGDINKYISATEPWKIKDDQARLGTVLHVAAQAVSDANHLLAPFTPSS